MVSWKHVFIVLCTLCNSEEIRFKSLLLANFTNSLPDQLYTKTVIWYGSRAFGHQLFPATLPQNIWKKVASWLWQELKLLYLEPQVKCNAWQLQGHQQLEIVVYLSILVCEAAASHPSSWHPAQVGHCCWNVQGKCNFTGSNNESLEAVVQIHRISV